MVKASDHGCLMSQYGLAHSAALLSLELTWSESSEFERVLSPGYGRPEGEVLVKTQPGQLGVGCVIELNHG